MKNKLSLFLFLLLSLPAGLLLAQTGNHYLRNYSPSDYGMSDQNWSTIQDQWGRIFAANGNGVLVYDGKNWKYILLRNSSRCISLDKDSANKIFVGGNGEFGYIETRKRGTLEYHSLSDSLPKSDSLFGNIWATRCINDEVFFGSNEKLFRYKKGKITSFKPDSSAFHTFFKVGKHLFVREKQVGFKVFKNDKLVRVKNSEIFADKRVDFILPYKDNIYWVGTRDDGMYHLLYNPDEPQKSIFSKFKTPVDEWMSEYQLYCGAKINDNMYALGSLTGGVLLTDKNFRPINKINTEKGLLDDGINNIFVDCNENIWLSLNFGISFIELNTPITRWTKNNGIKAVVESSIKFEGKLYIATDKGLQVLDEKKNKFIETAIDLGSFALLVKNNELLVGTTSGLYKLKNGKPTLLFESNIYCILDDPTDPDILYLGTDKGLLIASYSHGSFMELKNFYDWGEARSLALSKDGFLGVGTSADGIYVVNPHHPYTFEHLTVANGLLPFVNKNYVSENYIFSFNGDLMVGTDKGIYKVLTGAHPSCVKLTGLSDTTKKSPANHPIQIAKQINNEIWFDYTNNNSNLTVNHLISCLSLQNNQLTENRKMLYRIKGVIAKDFFKDSNSVYISTNDGLYCYNTSSKPKQTEFYSTIYRVYLKNETDSMIEDLTPKTKYQAIEIPYKSNEINMIPGASDYYDISGLQFSWYLEGKEDNYGNWANKSVIPYQNLHEGSYTFHLKAKNIFGQESKEVSFSFTVLPPWYRTTWAYMLYVLVLLVSVRAIVKLNTRRLKAQNVKLEQTITERTKTIVAQKAEIEVKNQEITDSINYAKRIQQAILPSIKEINKTWKDIFVFFQPKDIVSGDFYWYYKIDENEFLIAAADCTGHGVPGGFMSMICSDKLNEAVDISKTPSEILHHVNNAIKHALKRGEQENEARDGMEIALIRVNTQTRKVSFAGANRALWIVKNDTGELDEIKASKASVGSYTDYDFKYDQFEMQLSAGDQIYLSTDGYADQFGGSDGKKYMSKNFKKYILEVKSTPITQQYKLIKDNINSWMKGYEQVDDLLVIGVKL